MKKKFATRLVIISLLFTGSYLFLNTASKAQHAEDQIEEPIQAAIKKRPIGEFLIWESVSRYIMASYH